MTFFHESHTKNIKILKPNISNHNIPLIYFSDKRENVLVYLSNDIFMRQYINIQRVKYSNS